MHYIFGDELKTSAGQARSLRELSLIASGYREFEVYAVEVCRGCGWNHLVFRFLLGKAHATGNPQASSRPNQLEEV